MNLQTFSVPGNEALERLMDLRQQFPSTGRYPFLIGDPEEIERMHETARFDSRTLEEILDATKTVEIEPWLKHRRMEADEESFSERRMLGEWPGEIEEKGSISLHKDVLTGAPRPEVVIGSVELDQPWKLPAYLKYGNWNECPPPEIHCAFHRRWQAQFGSQITGISSDTIECIVLNPPLDPQTALELAWEQYWYCGDIVDQGTVTVSNLAATLLESPYWYFWWD